MLLAIDVGNTNITIGTFVKDDITAAFRMTTKVSRTSDEFGVMIAGMLSSKGISAADIEAAIISSVVPNVIYSLSSAIIKYFEITPVLISPGIKTGIKIACENPKEVGADRIVDCAAAYTIYGGPIIVIDYGTATTYDVVTEDGSFIAGITAPGIMSSAKALWGEAAKLPEIEVVKPDSILAKNTVTSMQAGLVYGQIGQTEYIIRQIKKELGHKEIKVVATGGLGRIIMKETSLIQEYDPNLTLKGLNIIYQKNQKKNG